MCILAYLPLQIGMHRNLQRSMSQFKIRFSHIEFKEILKIKNFSDTYGGSRKILFAFTENGIAMLSSVLNSDKAIVINISIIRIFTKLRSFLLLEKGLSERIDKLENGTNQVFKAVFQLKRHYQ